MNKKMLCFIAGIVLNSIFILNAQAANHYVRQGATGSGNGNDWTNAYTSLPATLIRGDTYYIAAGSYPSQTFSTPTNGTALITIKKANATDNSTVPGWQPSYATGQALFNGELDFTSSYWLIDGMTGGGAENNWNQNFGFKVTETNDSKAVIRIGYTGTANNITIRHVDMQGKGSVGLQGGSYGNDGLGIYGASNITLSYYWMHGIGRCPFFISPQNAVFEHGWVQSYYGSSGVHSEVASIWGFDGPVGDTTFRYNLFTDIQSTGGLMWDNSSLRTSHMYVYGNVFYKPAGAIWGVANGVIGGWTTTASSFNNVWVYNNTFINVDQQSLSTFPSVYSGNVAYNNLFYNCQAPNFSRFATHDYNHFINSGTTQGEPHGTTASGDPFVNFVGMDFRLKAATSPGTSLPSPVNLAPLGMTSVIYRGAYPTGGTAIPSPSPTILPPSDVRM